ncbi:MAG: PEP-CTERM sorting domain-containing protein [Planctomycetota bacterium]
MTRNLFKLSTPALAFAALAAATLTAQAQEANDVLWGNTDPAGGNWSVGTNWPQFGFAPEAATFNEQGVINNGGLAFVIDTPAPVGGVTLGTDDASTGALEIRSGGSLTVVDNGITSGVVEVGEQNSDVGFGFLTVERGGTLTTKVLRSGAGDSTITLGTGGGAGVATVNADQVLFRSDTRITPNVSLNFGQLRIGGQGNVITEVTSGGNAIINVTDFANLPGTLTLDFTDVTPSVGDSWTVLEAGAIASGFGALTTTAELGPGLGFTQQVVDSGNREQLVVDLEALLTLQVSRSTGVATIVSESGNPVQLTAYNLQSADGTINPAYNSLEDQSVGGFQESGPAGLTATQAGELSSIGGVAIDGTGVSLGSAYTPAAIPVFGAPVVDDLGFTYTDDTGRAFTGFVEFDEAPIANNLVLRIDPATGDARLINDSETALDLDVYSIASDSGALLTTWNSLADQAISTFQEANPSANRLSELDPTGSVAVAAGGFLELGGLWDINGLQDVDDLTLEFRDLTLGEFDGIVEFGAFDEVLLDGDANGDGNVDLLDLDILGSNFGLMGGATVADGDFNGDGNVDLLDLDILGSNFGATINNAVAVPEPTTLTGLLAAVATLLFRRRRVLAVVGGPTTTPSQPETTTMLPHFAIAFALAGVVAGTANAQPVTIVAADVADVVGAFTDGSITITPRDENGNISGFGNAARFFGSVSGSNAAAINDADGDPATTDDRDTVEISLTSGSALRDIGFAFTRANPVAVSGFASDPLATVAVDPNNSASLAYDDATGTLGIFYNAFNGSQVVIDFGNAAATDGQTLLFEVLDFHQAGPQLAFDQITYDDSFPLLTPGDVDGLGGVTIDDYNIIRDNFFTEGERADGDLTGDGFVSLVDYAQWESNFAGSSTGLEALLGVPEPSSLMLLSVLGAVAIGGSRRG